MVVLTDIDTLLKEIWRQDDRWIMYVTNYGLIRLYNPAIRRYYESNSVSYTVQQVWRWYFSNGNDVVVLSRMQEDI